MIYYRNDVKVAGPEDIERIRAILEDPDVAGTFGDIRGIPWETAVEDLCWLIWPGGLFAIQYRSDRSAWVHVAVRKWARGRPAIEAARQVRDRLFSAGCSRICGWTRADLQAARMFNLMLGFTPRKEVKKRVLYVLTKQEWEAANG